MFIQPKISREQAESIFAAKKSSFSWASKLVKQKNKVSPVRLEVLYLPFYLFDVQVEKEIKGKKTGDVSTHNVILTVDGLLGHAVLYGGKALDAENGREMIVPACDFEISAEDASKMALDQYKGILLEHGLRTRSHPIAESISEGRKIYYPFWIGYFKKKKGYDFRALDAVSGEIQGIKMRRVFIKALKDLSRDEAST
jgi:hypothetical protein